LGTANKVDPFFCEGWQDYFVEGLVLVMDQNLCHFCDGSQSFFWRATIKSQLRCSVDGRLSVGGCADLEKFVKVGGGDCQKTKSLQQGYVRVEGLGQDSPIELQDR
jgi:hypothetical protein